MVGSKDYEVSIVSSPDFFVKFSSKRYLKQAPDEFVGSPQSAVSGNTRHVVSFKRLCKILSCPSGKILHIEY